MVIGYSNHHYFIDRTQIIVITASNAITTATAELLPMNRAIDCEVSHSPLQPLK